MFIRRGLRAVALVWKKTPFPRGSPTCPVLCLQKDGYER